MKVRFICFSILVLACVALLLAAPAVAGTVYTNGPVNGENDAFTFNFGYTPSDSFTVSAGPTSLSGMSFWAWLYPDDTLQSVEIWITSDELGGTTYFDQVVSISQSNCFVNGYGYDVCRETGTFTTGVLNNGTYWVTLEGGVVSNGDPVYWDENDGPSWASESQLGTMPSEAFTLYGGGNGSTPEPGSLLLLASGIVGVAGVLRGKLR